MDNEMPAQRQRMTLAQIMGATSNASGQLLAASWFVDPTIKGKIEHLSNMMHWCAEDIVHLIAHYLRQEQELLQAKEKLLQYEDERKLQALSMVHKAMNGEQ